MKYLFAWILGVHTGAGRVAASLAIEEGFDDISGRASGREF
jgi:hypothetical protein